MSMKGIDISHWQGSISWSKTGVPFAIIKCSQGTTYKDPMFEANKAGARRAGILCGYYHFADGTDAKKEANWFVSKVGDIAKGEFLVLDWEIAHSNTVAWCKTFLDEVQRLVGFKPLIYINSSTAKKFDWSPVIRGDYGLWIASYGLNLPYIGLRTPYIGQWKFYALWQYSSRGKIVGITGYVDLNYTKMSLETLKKYGKQ